VGFAEDDQRKLQSTGRLPVSVHGGGMRLVQIKQAEVIIIPAGQPAEHLLLRINT
jgi:hypothetical protein